MPSPLKASLASVFIVICSVLVILLGLGFVLLPQQHSFLVWAGLVSGIIAILHSGNLEGLFPSTRRALFFTGLTASIVMIVLLFFVR